MSSSYHRFWLGNFFLNASDLLGILTASDSVPCKRRENVFPTRTEDRQVEDHVDGLKWAYRSGCLRAANQELPDVFQQWRFHKSHKHFDSERSISPTLSEKTSCLQDVSVEGEVDFIIVGNGVAGKSALRTLQRTCPQAKVAVIDPHVSSADAVFNHPKMRGFQAWVTFLDPQSRKVILQDYRHQGNHNQQGTAQATSSSCLRYKHGLLIATGSRGAPPPYYLMDEAARSRIMELRSTIVPNDLQSRPVQSMERVRNLILSEAASETTTHTKKGRASRSSRIAVLGSGWDAVDLAVRIASLNSISPFAGGGKLVKDEGQAVLVFGGATPLGHVLPNYLGSALSKRLESRNIAVYNRTLVRYISHVHGIKTEDNTNDDKNESPPLQLYTAKSYDFLDSNMDKVDWIVIAPEVCGSRGSAVLPTADIPSHLLQDDNGRTKKISSSGRCWYRPWSLLTVKEAGDAQRLACYKDDGRIVVNSELRACSGVYAAGSVAKYPNGLSGHADVAGYGVEDGREAGHIAAWNMSRHFRAETTAGILEASMVKNPIPVFRSDRLSHSDDGETSSSLMSVGVNALCVGNCDCERFLTHGIWWTNLAAQRRFLNLKNIDGTPVRRRKTKRDPLKLVYGIGVVYYMDKTGKIQGIMTWGLPFTAAGQGSELNQEILGFIKGMILSNGGFRSLQSEADQLRMSEYLTEQSRRLVALAFSGFIGGGGGDGEEEDESGRMHRLNGELKDFPRPLHRFTEARPPNVRSFSLLRRKDGQAHGVLGEDMFARFQADPLESITTATTLASRHVGFAAEKAKSFNEWNRWEQVERHWEDNEQQARPAKEELLWIRKGDEMRSTSARDVIISAYNSAIWSSNKP